MIGAVLADRYTIVRELGRGGSGVVYLARDAALDRDVALKVLGGAALGYVDAEHVRRDVRAAARLDHPNVVAVHDVIRNGDDDVVVETYVKGESLREALGAGPLELATAVDVGWSVAEALVYAHDMNVVHGNLKPENVLLERDERGALRVRVTDFGVATTELAARASVPDIPARARYLSPEQLVEASVGATSDVYALGALLYECLAGVAAFAGEGASLFYRVSYREPKSLAAVRPDAPHEIVRLVRACLEKAPARRPRTAREVAAALAPFRSPAPDPQVDTADEPQQE